MPTLVKICGITRVTDALAACAAGADALGFVFSGKSPRQATIETVCAVGAALPRPLLKVGVFVDAPLDRVRAVREACGLDRVQLHGSEGPEFADQVGCPCWKALRVCGAPIEAELDRFRGHVEYVLLDALVAGQAGGTGQTCDWRLAAAAARRAPILLAGGLAPENVAAALDQVRPAGVDVSSGVESQPGRKDAARVQAFIREVRTWDCRIAGGTSANSGASSSPRP